MIKSVSSVFSKFNFYGHYDLIKSNSWVRCFASLLLVFSFSEILFASSPIPIGGGEALPHDIKSIIPYKYTFSLGVLLAILLGILLLGLLAWFLYQRSKKAKKVAIRKVNLPLEVYKAVSALKPEDPFLKKQQEDYFYHLGFNLRHYIELKTQISATDLTFQELKTPLRTKLCLPGEQTREIISFLEKSEYIKFASNMVTVDEALKYRLDVLRWMDQLNLSSKTEDEEKLKKGVSNHANKLC